ncbi:hypothetical protein GGR63_003790 [Xanthomonas sp. 3272]|nr:hypothetical protein [Xanthomonas arboricola]
MKKRFSEEQIIGFLREAEAGIAIKDVCRRHGFSEASNYLSRSKLMVWQWLAKVEESGDARLHSRPTVQAAMGDGCDAEALAAREKLCGLLLRRVSINSRGHQ